jgi:hypothetical protein
MDDYEGDEVLDEIMNDWRNGNIDDEEALAHLSMGVLSGDVDPELYEMLEEAIDSE